MYKVDPSDFLTVMQRIRGRARTIPKTTFRAQVLYKIPKTVRISKTEPRWRCGVWASSDEHLVGTSRGGIKRKSNVSLPDTQRFSPEALDSSAATRQNARNAA